jgi:diadenosine tetraphosphate (Ap4A) HIT family hydrolase
MEQPTPHDSLPQSYADFISELTVCPFCVTVHNEVLAERTHAFLTYALAPYHRHHLLVIPKRHLESLEAISKEEAEDIDALERVGLSALKSLGYESVSLLVREGLVNDMKSVAHVHFHIIPDIRIGDVDHYGQERRILSKEEIEETVKAFEGLL